MPTNFFFVYHLIMGVAIFAGGIVVMLYPPTNFEQQFNVSSNLLGGVLIAYGVFRLFRSYVSYRDQARAKRQEALADRALDRSVEDQ